jgi:UDP-galactopyranose mutase
LVPSLARESANSAFPYDLVCLSHLRWDFVYQRPQHLLSRCARERRVFFVEEPLYEAGERAYLHIREVEARLWVITPHLPQHTDEAAAEAYQRKMLDGLLAQYAIGDYVLWYYTPMALSFSDHLEPLAIIYDCMDELSAFRFAPCTLKERESRLLRCADLVFTGGYSLYEAKRRRHPHVYAFPSSVDAAHFAQARSAQQDPADQAPIPQPRVGFYGVIDERIDLELLAAIADAQRGWQFVIVGPVAKIDPHSLPGRENIHYLGPKTYQELPRYLAGWEAAMMPFALNEATRYISPTKTLEYLAGGKPVVSTPIRDVVRPYGEQRLALIASTPQEFIAALQQAMAEEREPRLRRVDPFLAQLSWDATWKGMRRLIDPIAGSRSDWLPYSISSTSTTFSGDTLLPGGSV